MTEKQDSERIWLVNGVPFTFEKIKELMEKGEFYSYCRENYPDKFPEKVNCRGIFKNLDISTEDFLKTKHERKFENELRTMFPEYFEKLEVNKEHPSDNCLSEEKKKLYAPLIDPELMKPSSDDFNKTKPEEIQIENEKA